MSQEKGIGGKKRGYKGPEAAISLSVGAVSVLQRVGVTEGFVASHEVAEGVADEDLLHFLGCGEPFDHGHGGRELAVDLRKARPSDGSGGIHRLGGIPTLQPPVVVIALEGKSQGIHFLVTALAFRGGGGFLQSVAERGVLFLRNAGIYTDGHVGHGPAKQVGAYPFAPLNGVVFEIPAPCGEPCRMGKDAGAFVLGKGDRLVGEGPFPVVGQVETGLVGPGLVVALDEDHALVFLVLVVGVDVVLSGGEQGVEHLSVRPEDVAHVGFEIGHEAVGVVLAVLRLVLEDLLRVRIVEILPEELDHARVLVLQGELSTRRSVTSFETCCLVASSPFADASRNSLKGRLPSE